MAKQPALKITVDAAQVQQFADIFNKLSSQITGITKAFSTLQTQTAQTAKSVQTLNNSLAGMLATSNRIHTSIAGITQQFGKWATLIGGTMMMLGSGAGMFGLDRLLNSFIQRQRQALGAGTSYQETLAANVSGQQFPWNAQQQLNAIATARIDPRHPAWKLLKPGNRFGIQTEGKTNEQIRRQLLEIAPDYQATLKPGTAGVTMEQEGFTSVLGEDAIRAFTTPEGRRAGHRAARLSKLLEEQVPKVTEEEEDKLDLLYSKWTLFASVFQADLIKMLAAMSPFLGKIATGMTEALPKIPSWLDWVTDLNIPMNIGKRAIDLMLHPTMENFKRHMDDLNQVIGNTVTKLNTLLNLLGGGPSSTSSTSSPISNFGQPVPVAPSVAPASNPAAASSVPSMGNIVSSPFINSFMVPRAYGSAVTTPKFGSGSVPSLGPEGAGAAWPSQLPGPGLIRGGSPLPNFPSRNIGPSGSLGGTNRFVSRQAPGRGGLSSALAMNNQLLISQMTAPGGPMGRSGALDMDQWQMGRTASIHIHNDHPSVHTQLAGMS